jgi:hypothetical protein
MTVAARKYLDFQWDAGMATVRIRHPRPGSELAEVQAALGAMGYDAPLPEGPAAVALGVRTPNLNVAPLLDVDALLALDGQSVVVELPVPLIEQAIAAATRTVPAPREAPAVPDPSEAPFAVETLPAQPDQPSEPTPPEPEQPAIAPVQAAEIGQTQVSPPHPRRNYAVPDTPLIAQMHRRLTRKQNRAKNVTDAARLVVKIAQGEGTEDSKVKRLVARYYQIHPKEPPT